MPTIFSSETPKVSKEDNLSEKKGHPLSSFCYYPANANFINQEEEEKIILLLRKHPITNVSWIITAFLMILVPPFFSFFDFFSALPTDFQLVITLTWYLITSAFIIEKFLNWFFNVNIITDERIIDVDFYSLIYREISDANIDQIQDVTVEVGGAIRTFLNYGDVLIQTAAEIPKIKFEAVPRPDEVAKVLRELRVEEEQEKIEGRVR